MENKNMEKECIINGVRYVAVKEVEPTASQSENKVKPTLDDYKTIKTYEDACEALGIVPIDNVKVFPSGNEAKTEKSMIAFVQLETVAKALRGGKPNTLKCGEYSYPHFAIYSNTEVKNMSKETKCRKKLTKCNIRSNGNSYIGYVISVTAITISSDYMHCSIPFQLLLPGEKMAEYFGTQFIELWADYMF